MAIKTYTAKCDIFIVVGFTQPIETLLPCKMPSSPWTKMGLDLFSFDNRDYFITVVITNILVISNRPDTKSTTMIKKLKAQIMDLNVHLKNSRDSADCGKNDCSHGAMIRQNLS